MSSAAGIDYSAWDHIYVSDDEDVTSPFVDTWRHFSRLERTADFEQRGEHLETNFTECKRQIAQAEDRLRELEDNGQETEDHQGMSMEREKVQKDLQKLRTHLQKFEKMLEKHRREKKKQPWNVDTISKEGFSKSVLNIKAEPLEPKDQDEAQKHQSFVDKYNSQIRHFGLLRRWDDSQGYLSDHPHLVCEETASALVHMCISMELEQKQALMGQVAHQAIVMKFILDLAETLRVDPRGCFRHFFSRIKAQRRKEEEEEQRERRLGPGGLDPQEVYKSLPQEMQRGFAEKNMELLQRAMDTLHPEEAKYHLRRCIDSGLWVPDCGEDREEEEEDEEEEDKEKQDEEDVEKH
uniref:Hsp90 co-chaperone Cdc37 n=1 Tax=Periophthalmus magnuspinnatus TaxID=409849 RepID=A0A3B4AM13_9GOBI